MPILAEHTITPVVPHETVFVRGGGGGVQHVPWNLPADGNVRVGGAGFGDGAVFGGLGALTDDEKQKLAKRITAAMFSADITAILEIIPTVAERREVAALAVAMGANAQQVQTALDNLETKQSWKVFTKPMPTAYRVVWSVLSTASFAASVYHGVKRNNGSIGWGLWWGLMGALFPVVTPVVAFAMPPGFAKPKRGGLARSYRRRRRS